MDTQTNWTDETEATDLELIAALEADILKGKEELSRLSADDILFF
jgi:hypothetical protein